jgi:hypothetical protein
MPPVFAVSLFAVIFADSTASAAADAFLSSRFSAPDADSAFALPPRRRRHVQRRFHIFSFHFRHYWFHFLIFISFLHHCHFHYATLPGFSLRRFRFHFRRAATPYVAFLSLFCRSRAARAQRDAQDAAMPRYYSPP